VGRQLRDLCLKERCLDPFLGTRKEKPHDVEGGREGGRIGFCVCVCEVCSMCVYLSMCVYKVWGGVVCMCGVCVCGVCVCI
jgi:hypothetical protein